MFIYTASSSKVDTTPSGSSSPFLDPNAKRRQRDRERYAQMPDEKKQGLLKKRREAYKRKKDSNVLPNVKNPHCINFEDNQPSSSHATQSSQTCPVQLNGTLPPLKLIKLNNICLQFFY